MARLARLARLGRVGRVVRVVGLVGLVGWWEEECGDRVGGGDMSVSWMLYLPTHPERVRIAEAAVGWVVGRVAKGGTVVGIVASVHARLHAVLKARGL